MSPLPTGPCDATWSCRSHFPPQSRQSPEGYATTVVSTSPCEGGLSEENPNASFHPKTMVGCSFCFFDQFLGGLRTEGCTGCSSNVGSTQESRPGSWGLRTQKHAACSLASR